jgi:RNA polymerase sigma-54 factor
MRPLVLRDVAEDVGIHESTVSRAIANKYIATPRGIYPLKKFFTTGLKGRQGQDVASESVKERIREMINNEDAAHPLSDEEIAKTLSRDDVTIARRTVAKYRESMNILPSAKRKQLH